jgi:hypothetical protein
VHAESKHGETTVHRSAIKVAEAVLIVLMRTRRQLSYFASPRHFPAGSMHRSQKQIRSAFANLSTEFHALFNVIAEVKAGENSR